MIIEVYLTFLLRKSSGLQSKHPNVPSSPPPPQGCVQGVGEKWIFSSSSHSFSYGYEAVLQFCMETFCMCAVRIRVQIHLKESEHINKPLKIDLPTVVPYITKSTEFP
jgi:hypothetical protein